MNSNSIIMKRSIIYLGIALDDAKKYSKHSKILGNKISKSLIIITRIIFLVPNRLCLIFIMLQLSQFLLQYYLVWSIFYHLKPLFINKKND